MAKKPAKANVAEPKEEPPFVLPKESKSLPVSKPVTVLEKEWVSKSGQTVILSFNNRAMMVLEELTGVSAFSFAFAPKPGFAYMATLTFAMAQSWLRGSNSDITFDDWVDGNWLPDYFQPEWHSLVRLVQELIESTFPDAEAQREGLRLLISAILAESPQAFRT